MTNLQKLIEVLRSVLDEKTISNTVLDYFDDQDAAVFEVDGTEYHVLDRSDVEELLEEQYEDEVTDAFLAIEDRFPQYVRILNRIDSYDIVRRLTSEFDYDGLSGRYAFIRKAENSYIYEVN